MTRHVSEKDASKFSGSSNFFIFGVGINWSPFSKDKEVSIKISLEEYKTYEDNHSFQCNRIITILIFKSVLCKKKWMMKKYNKRL